jgi:hypothetical protein
MRFFTEADQHLLDATGAERDRLRHQLEAAFEAAQRFAEANLSLAAEITRLSQRAVPVVPDGDIDQPTSTRDTDREAAITLNDPENLRRPKPGPARVDD